MSALSELHHHAPDDPGGDPQHGHVHRVGSVLRLEVTNPPIFNLGVHEIREVGCTWDTWDDGPTPTGPRSVQVLAVDLASHLGSGGLEALGDGGVSLPISAVRSGDHPRPSLGDAPHAAGASLHCGPTMAHHLARWGVELPVEKSADGAWRRAKDSAFVAVVFRPGATLVFEVEVEDPSAVRFLRVTFPGLSEAFQGRPAGVRVYHVVSDTYTLVDVSLRVDFGDLAHDQLVERQTYPVR